MLAAMTPEAQRIAIAEACPGLTFGVITDKDPEIWVWPSGRVTSDPLSDLNAMHEAEKVLVTTDYQNRYQAHIAEICYGDEFRKNNQVVFNQLTATAAQRAEAFLRTLNLWQP